MPSLCAAISIRKLNIDVFVDEPIAFDSAIQRSIQVLISPGLNMTVGSYADLVLLKLRANRPKDQLDLEQLRISRGET